MRLALVVNPRSGSAPEPDALATRLAREGANVDVYDVGAGERALERDPDRLVVAGGDGSLGAYAALAAARGIAMAVVPVGTANDFARALGLPLDLGAAADLAATGTQTRAIEVLRAGDRPFLNAASTGLSVRAAREAHGLKRALGPLAYASGAVRAGLTAAPLGVVVRLDGRELFAGEAWQVIVAGTGAFGGGAEVDAADPTDGLLDVAVLEAGPRAALVRHAAGMRRGGLTAQEGVVHGRGREVTLDVPDPSFNVDGELVRVEPPRFSTRGERVDVVVAP